MMSPFDSKNRVATALDRLALRVLLFLLSVGYFFALWHSGAPSLLAGSALFALAMLTLLLLERRTLARRDRALRVRVGGAIALEGLRPILCGKDVSRPLRADPARLRRRGGRRARRPPGEGRFRR